MILSLNNKELWLYSYVGCVEVSAATFSYQQWGLSAPVSQSHSERWQGVTGGITSHGGNTTHRSHLTHPDGGSDARVIITEVISWVWTEDGQWRLVWGGSCDGLTTRKRSAYTFLELQHDSCAGPSPPLVFAILAVKWQLNTWINSARCLLPINKGQESKDKASDCDALTSLLSAPSNWRSVLLIIWLVQRPSDYRFGLLT